MKILHVVKSNIYSGAEHVICTIIHNMPQAFDCYYLSPDGPITDRLKEEGIAHILVDKTSVASVKKAIIDLEPDVVHAHDFTASVIAAFACQSLTLANGKKPVVISHLHNNWPWMEHINIKTIAYGLATKSIDHIITVSDAVINGFVFGKKLISKTSVIGNPFSLAEIYDKEPKGPGSPQLACDLLFVGRLVAQKNPLGFLAIVNALKADYGLSDIKASLAGDGQLMDECKEYLASHDLQDKVTLAGFQSNPYAYMKASRILVMPSEWEGFGLVALEAMAFGKPVVCSGAGGLASIVDDSCGKVVGRLSEDVDKSMVKAYASEIHRLLTDDSYYESKSQGAYARVSKYDNLHSYIANIVDIYKA